MEDDERRVRAARVPLRDERGGHAARLQRERLQRELGGDAARLLRPHRLLPVRIQVRGLD